MQNFGKIKNAFNDILAESIIDKDVEKRKIVKRFIKAISESKVLKTQFIVYNNIETSAGGSEFTANLFVTEGINALERIGEDVIIAENQKLVNMSQMVKSRLENDYDKKDLHESIAKLAFTKAIPVNAKVITENRYAIIKYIVDNEVKTITESDEMLPTSLIANLAVDKFNEKYADLTEDEHKVLKVILEADNDEAKENIFNETKSSCLESVNARLTESTNKEKLLDVKEKLLNTMYTNETFSDNIAKLLDLKRTLTKD